MRRLLGAVFGGVGVALMSTTPAWAHGADAPSGTDYRTEVTAVVPALPGVTVRTVEAGARLSLENRSASVVEVLGYDGEPYLEVRPDGVYQNVHSPAVYRNATLSGEADLPPQADPAQPPSWEKVSTEPIALWHDTRTHWMSVDRPPEVAADPSVPHRIRDWIVPLRVDASAVELRGTLDWLPPPSAVPWWSAAAVGALAVGAVGLPRRVSVLPVLAAVSLVGGAVALAYALARSLDAGASAVGGVLLTLVAGQLWPVVVGLAAMAAAAYAALRRPAVDFVLALAGTCLALFAGLTNVAVFSTSVAPVPWPAAWARAAVAVVLAAGAGVALAGTLRARAVPRSRPVESVA